MTRIRSLVTGATIALLTMMTLALPAAAQPDKPTPTPGSGSTDPGVSPMHCTGHAHSNIDTRANGTYFDANFVNIRGSGPHTPECPSDGQGQLTHIVDYHCFASGDTVTRSGVGTFSTWTYLRNVTTGVVGWVSDAYLDIAPGTNFRGSLVHC